MTALSLLRHALELLTHHPLKTLRVISPAVALMIGVSIIAVLTTPEISLGVAGDDAPMSVPTNWLLLAGMTFSYAMMAILWHRHTLGGAGISHPISIPLILSYLLRVAQLTLIQLSVSLALIIPLIISSQNSASDGPAFHSVMLTTFATQLLLVWLSLRLSLILPAAAIGQPIKLMMSWKHTQLLNHPLWRIAALLALINTGLTGLAGLFDLKATYHLMVFELPIYIFEGLLIFSILTTLYKLQVQKLPIDGT
ncbi:hypothetical protein [uncultured Sulfitobacter sp.]|uniref:hypothetical protein n=1 Tax=uncultured Sulfitobacter sp. TaxID=191468 RepID=UPI00260E8EF9|nr:hypothetical protein [uncultured Sulfitobacter sp.]